MRAFLELPNRALRWIWKKRPCVADASRRLDSSPSRSHACCLAHRKSRSFKTNWPCARRKSGQREGGREGGRGRWWKGTACARASVCRGSLEAPGGKPTEREKDGTELTCSHGVLWHRAHTYSRKRVLWHRTYTLVPSTHMMAASTCTYSHRVLQERSSRQASHLLSELERQRSAIGAYELTYLELRARGRERAQRWVVRHRRAAAEEGTY